MNELKITKEKVLEAAAKCETAKQTLKTLFPECFSKKPVDSGVKSYEDVCKEIGQTPLTIYDFKMFKESQRITQFALHKLETIVEFLNEGKQPSVKNKERRYYPYFMIKSGGSGLVFNDSLYDDAYADTGSAARLAFLSEDLSTFAGRTFIREYAEFIYGETRNSL